MFRNIQLCHAKWNSVVVVTTTTVRNVVVMVTKTMEVVIFGLGIKTRPSSLGLDTKNTLIELGLFLVNAPESTIIKESLADV